jgi:hypothetical protein
LLLANDRRCKAHPLAANHCNVVQQVHVRRVCFDLRQLQQRAEMKTNRFTGISSLNHQKQVKLSNVIRQKCETELRRHNYNVDRHNNNMHARTRKCFLMNSCVEIECSPSKRRHA